MQDIRVFQSKYSVMVIAIILFPMLILSNHIEVQTLAMPEALAAERSNIKFGLYSAIWMRGSHEEQIARMKELQAMGVNTVIQGRYTLGERFKMFVRDLHVHGIKLATKVTGRNHWFGQGGKGNFDPSKAEEKLRKASFYEEFFDYLYLAHEVHEFATHEERVRMYRLAKRYFPKTPILMYYGGSIDRMERNPNKKRRTGKLLKEYQFGPMEADIALIATQKRTIDGEIDIEASRKRLEQVTAIIRQKSPNTEIWVNTSFAGDHIMRSNKTGMWSPEEIRGYGQALIQSGKLGGFFFRAYGRFTYDLGYSEWEEQRRAFASLSPARN